MTERHGWRRLLRNGNGPHAGRQSFVIETIVDGEPCTVRVLRWEVFQRWRKRATWAFVAVFLAATAAAYLADHARRTSAESLSMESRRAVERSCVDRADVRITVAVGFDELRRFAIGASAPNQSSTERQLEIAAFLARTQPPIDRLLSEAAGATVKTKGELTAQQVETTRTLATDRCKVAADRFEQVISASG